MVRGTESATDLARGRPAKASSMKSRDRMPEFAVDGNPSTRWTSAYEDNQWISVDLGAPYKLSRIEIRWETAYAESYQLEGSLDGLSWTAMALVAGRPGWVSTPLPRSSKARWIRMSGKQRATQFGFSIYDLRVFAEGDEAEKRAAEEDAASSAAPLPLTARWLQRHGCPVVSVREEELPAEENSGMASVCTLLWLRHSYSRPPEPCIAKRSRGASDEGGLRHLQREWLFYTDVLPREGVVSEKLEHQQALRRQRGGEAAATGGGCMLAGVLRVPRCRASNWLAASPAVHASERADAFLLVLERFGTPLWAHVDPEVGCIEEQAQIAVETMARFHAAFAQRKRLDALSWLPVTLLDADNIFGFQLHFSGIWHRSSYDYGSLLSAEADSAACSLSEGGIVTAVQRIARPPLTLLHGDFKPENLCFATRGQPPAVAAFDWEPQGEGNMCRGRGAFDFTYFAVLSAPPEIRRLRDEMLKMRYRQALSAAGIESCAALLKDFEDDVKAASLVILAILISTLAGSMYQSRRTEEMLRRSLRYVSEAVSDWGASAILA